MQKIRFKIDLSVAFGDSSPYRRGAFWRFQQSPSNSDLTNGQWLASQRLEDIAAHEFGHMLTDKIGNSGIEIAMQAYYNIYEENISVDDVILYLAANISEYAVILPGMRENQKITVKRYKEVIPEVLAKHNSNPNDFTTEFVSLLKGV